MKKLLILALLAACTTAPTENPTHKAVSNYLQKTLDDPASYQSIGWGHERPYTTANQLHDQARYMQIEASAQANLALENQKLVYQLSGNSLPEAQHMRAEKQQLSDTYSRKSDSLAKAASGLLASTDTTRMGWTVVHTYRTKNKLGALELDSAEFIVLPGAKVARR